MNRIILILLTPLILLAAPSVKATDNCSAGDPPDACFSGMCTPYLGPPPVFAGDVCCDVSAGWCEAEGTRGCSPLQTAHYCEYGQTNAASGEVECFFETYQIDAGDPPPAATEQPLCCTDNGCTIPVAGCEGGGTWIGYCSGDLLIMEDGSAHCFEDC